MKTSIYALFIVSGISLMTACGDSKIRELRGEFIEGCKSGGAKRDVCSCVFDKMEEKYTRDELLDMKIGIFPKDYIDFIAESTLRCTRDN